MKMWLYIVFAAMSCVAAVAAEPRFGGTFIGAIVCEDGIIVASDSRSTFEDGSRKRVGYVDGMTKIFVQQGAAFAVSGLTSIGDELFPSFVRRNEFLLARPVNEVLFGVSVWLPFQNSTNVLLISAGYVNGEPMICARGPNNPQVCRKAGYVTNRDSASLSRWYAETRGVLPKAETAAAVLKQAILESAAADRTVGGPISILHLRKTGGPQWLENRPGNEPWTKVCELVGDYRRGRAQIGFTSTKDELDGYLSAACPR